MVQFREDDFSTVEVLYPPQNCLDTAYLLVGIMFVVIKLPYLKSSMLCSKLSKGMGHNSYGEPA